MKFLFCILGVFIQSTFQGRVQPPPFSSCHVHPIRSATPPPASGPGGVADCAAGEGGPAGLHVPPLLRHSPPLPGQRGLHPSHPRRGAGAGVCPPSRRWGWQNWPPSWLAAAGSAPKTPNPHDPPFRPPRPGEVLYPHYIPSELRQEFFEYRLAQTVAAVAVNPANPAWSFHPVDPPAQHACSKPSPPNVKPPLRPP